MTLLVENIAHLVQMRFDCNSENAPTILSKRIDMAHNRGNNGIFLHEVQVSPEKIWKVIEKFPTSHREWFFFEHQYDHLKRISPGVTPELYAIRRNNDNPSIFLEHCKEPVVNFSVGSATVIARLISVVQSLPKKGMESHPLRVDKAERIEKYLSDLSNRSDIGFINRKEIVQFSQLRDEMNEFVRTIPVLPAHGDLKWANMTISSEDSGRITQLIDWGDFACRTEGFDIKEFISFTDKMELENAQFIEQLVASCAVLSLHNTPASTLKFAAFLARANWALIHYCHYNAPKYGLLFECCVRELLKNYG